jgi:hypothetical protein
MPPSPRNSPALKVALSRDTKRAGDHGWQDGKRERRLLLFGDGAWHPVEVLAWWTDDHGRQVVQVEWHAELDTFGESFLADPERMREG